MLDPLFDLYKTLDSMHTVYADGSGWDEDRICQVTAGCREWLCLELQ